jgi:BlaI family transcriptional regulator, penicillinase repressor
MALPRLSRLELQIMETLWARGASSVRELQEAFPENDRPAFTTVQTIVTRLEAKKAVRLTKRIGKANIFEAAISRKRAHGRLIDELLDLFGSKPVMAHMIRTGQLTLEDIKEAEQELRKLARRERDERSECKPDRAQPSRKEQTK